MAQGARYIVGGTLNVYLNSDDAIARRNPRSTITDSYSSVEGAGTPWVHWWPSGSSAVAIWWMPSWGGSGYILGWVNDNDNWQATTPTISPASVTMGSRITISLSPNNPGITHTVTWKFGSATGTLATKTLTRAIYFDSYVSLASQIPNATSGVGSFTVTSYNGTKVIGTAKTINFTLKVPTSVVPSIGTIGVVEAGVVPAAWGVYVQSKSKAKVTIPATLAYGSAIKTYSMTVENKPYSSTSNVLTSGYITGSGTITITAKVTDTRGRSTSKSTTISVVAYSNPSITRFSVYRYPNDSSTTIRVSAKMAISSVSNKNGKVWRIQWRLPGGSWNTAGTASDVYTLDVTTLSYSGYDIDKSYEFQFYVADSFHGTRAYDIIGTEAVTFDIRANGKGFAVGKVSEKDAFEVAMPTEFTSTVKVANSSVVTDATLGNVARRETYNNFVHSGNEMTFMPPGYSGIIYMNYRTSSGLRNGNLTAIHWLIGNGATSTYTNMYAKNYYASEDLYSRGSKAWTDARSTFNNATNGRLVLPNGFILQWGRMSIASGSVSATFSFPYAFPNACRSIVGSWQTDTGYNESYTVSFNTVSRTGAKAFCKRYDSVMDFVRYVYWQAIGY